MTFDLCVLDAETGNVYIMMEARLVALYKSEEEYKVLERYGELVNQIFWPSVARLCNLPKQFNPYQDECLLSVY